jgi:hypothetical protein
LLNLQTQLGGENSPPFVAEYGKIHNSYEKVKRGFEKKWKKEIFLRHALCALRFCLEEKALANSAFLA